METREGYLYPLLVLGALSFVALSIVGIVEILRYSPEKSDAYKQSVVLCADCGIVEAVQQPGNPPAEARSIGISENAMAQGTSTSSFEGSRFPSRYAVRVRMNDGTTEVVYRRLKPQFDVGDRVKLVDNAMVAIE